MQGRKHINDGRHSRLYIAACIQHRVDIKQYGKHCCYDCHAHWVRGKLARTSPRDSILALLLDAQDVLPSVPMPLYADAAADYEQYRALEELG